MTYRKDIDGLRALAVLAVLLFHVGLTTLSGGYLGVDVFFTISGFLITSLILRDLTQKKFNPIRFYLRRVRRLLPALFITVLVTWVAGLFILTPEHFEHFSKSSIWATFSISNIFFWLDAGYFSDAAIHKPLLHTWSLSVEEQFYLIWPAMLVFLVAITRRSGSRTIIWLSILSLSVISIFASEWVMRTNPSATFYLMPFRIAEFGIGALCIPLLHKFGSSKTLSTLIFWLGLTVLLICFVGFDETIRFPGVNSLLPSLATAGVILGGKNTIGHFILSNPIAVWIGKISYSLYLVHWPVVVYFRYNGSAVVKFVEILQMFALSVLLASILYYTIEKLFRDKRETNSPQAYPFRKTIGLWFITLTALLSGVYGWLNHGLAWRLPEDIQKFASKDEEIKNQLLNGGLGCRSTICPMGTEQSNYETILFVGDSHMHHYYHGFDQELKSLGKKGLMIQEGACPFFTNDIYARESVKDSCSKDRERFWKLAESTPSAPIILSQNWVLYNAMLTSDRKAKPFPERSSAHSSIVLYIEEEVRTFIERAGNRRVVLIGPSPQTHLKDSISKCLLRPNLWARFTPKSVDWSDDNSCMTMSNRTKNFEDARNINKVFNKISATKSNVSHLNPFDAFCDEDKCVGATRETIYYRDNSHLSVSGGKQFLIALRQDIDNAFQSPEKNNSLPKPISLNFSQLDLWFAQAKADVEKSAEQLNVGFPADGRITFKQRLDPIFLGPSQLKLRLDYEVTGEIENANFRIVLQRGCDPVPLEGQSFDYTIEKGRMNIESEMTILEDAECIMVRIWNNKVPFEAIIHKADVSLSPY